MNLEFVVMPLPGEMLRFAQHGGTNDVTLSAAKGLGSQQERRMNRTAHAETRVVPKRGSSFLVPNGGTHG